MLYYHPIFCFIVFTSFFMGLELFVGFGLWLLASMYTSESLQKLLSMDQLPPEEPTFLPRTGHVSPSRLSGRFEHGSDNSVSHAGSSRSDLGTGPSDPGVAQSQEGETGSESGTVTESHQAEGDTSANRSRTDSEHTPASVDNDSLQHDAVAGLERSGEWENRPGSFGQSTARVPATPQDWDMQLGLRPGRALSLGRLSEATEESTSHISTSNDSEVSTISGRSF